MKRCFLLLVAFSAAVMTFADEPIRVLTINVRLSYAQDGENSWPNRKEFMMDVVTQAPDGSGPYDFVGTQETVVDPRPEFNQVAYIIEKMPAYGSLYLSREKTPEKGEAMLLLWKKDRWKIDPNDQGTFWLSETPDVPGSKTDPKAGCPRIVTFGLFHELADGKATGRRVYVANTHYDHLSVEARQRAAKQVMDWIVARKERHVPLIFMGDLNNAEQSPAIRYMLGDSMKLDGQELSPPCALIDTFRAANPDATDVGTFHGFKEVGKNKIDYIFVTPPLTTVSATIIRTKRDGRWPTDHCPVEAVVRF